MIVESIKSRIAPVQAWRHRDDDGPNCEETVEAVPATLADASDR